MSLVETIAFLFLFCFPFLGSSSCQKAFLFGESARTSVQEYMCDAIEIIRACFAMVGCETK